MAAVTQPRGSLAVPLRLLRERPVLSVFALALAGRVLVALAVYVLNDGTLVLDDRSYSNLALLMSTDRESAFDLYASTVYERTEVLTVPLTFLYEIFGEFELAGQLYVALFGAAAAAVTTRLALEMVETRWALFTGLVVAALPSQVLFSSLILKDAEVWLVIAGLALATAVACRTEDPRRLALLGAVAAAGLIALGELRFHTQIIAAWALAIAAWFGVPRWRAARGIGAAAIAFAVLLGFHLGPAGLTFASNQVSPSERRAANAENANTAIVEPTKESTVKLDDAARLEADVKHLPRGLSVVLLEPYPWQAGGTTPLKLARGEALLWYPLLLLALVGLIVALRRANRRVMAFPLLAGGVILVVYALTEGNVGTAYRHRGELVPVVALLAALGARELVSRRRARAARAHP